jgi:hypothetical protein
MMGVNQHLINTVLFEKLKPYLQERFARDRNEAFGRMKCQWPQASAATSSQ